MVLVCNHIGSIYAENIKLLEKEDLRATVISLGDKRVSHTLQPHSPKPLAFTEPVARKLARTA